mmetsp:Transcript_43884/g.42409  ORF Transcript_43884/g.42409 Transcript_43884/m.42409 type:complete len:83 (-) Transcript_43884:968-1216(-)
MVNFLAILEEHLISFKVDTRLPFFILKRFLFLNFLFYLLLLNLFNLFRLLLVLSVLGSILGWPAVRFRLSLGGASLTLSVIR